MVIVGMGLRSNSVERFPNRLSCNEIFKMNSSVWRDIRSRNGSQSRIVGLHEGNRVWRVSPDNACSTRSILAGDLDPWVQLPVGIPTGIPTGYLCGPTPVLSLIQSP